MHPAAAPLLLCVNASLFSSPRQWLLKQFQEMMCLSLEIPRTNKAGKRIKLITKPCSIEQVGAADVEEAIAHAASKEGRRFTAMVSAAFFTPLCADGGSGLTNASLFTVFEQIPHARTPGKNNSHANETPTRTTTNARNPQPTTRGNTAFPAIAHCRATCIHGSQGSIRSTHHKR